MFEKRHSTCVNTVTFQKQWLMGMGSILGKWGSKRFVLPLKEKNIQIKKLGWRRERKKIIIYILRNTKKLCHKFSYAN